MQVFYKVINGIKTMILRQEIISSSHIIALFPEFENMFEHPAGSPGGRNKFDNFDLGCENLKMGNKKCLFFFIEIQHPIPWNCRPDKTYIWKPVDKMINLLSYRGKLDSLILKQIRIFRFKHSMQFEISWQIYEKMKKTAINLMSGFLKSKRPSCPANLDPVNKLPFVKKV